jgi:hypothetical protein
MTACRYIAKYSNRAAEQWNQRYTKFVSAHLRTPSKKAKRSRIKVTLLVPSISIRRDEISALSTFDDVEIRSFTDQHYDPHNFQDANSQTTHSDNLVSAFLQMASHAKLYLGIVADKHHNLGMAPVIEVIVHEPTVILRM